MEKQKTAVEWLEEQLFFISRPDIFSQAKQMEKEQIVASHKEGQHYANNFEVPHHRQSEKYYQSKYGKDENKAENND